MFHKHLLTLVSNKIWPRPAIKINLGQSVVIIGRPGTGKSVFLRWLLQYAQSVIVYDSKYDPKEWPQQKDYKIVEQAGELTKHGRVVLRCPGVWLQDKEGWETPGHPWSVALEAPMQRGDTIAAFDEALNTWPNRGAHPGTHRLVQQGRSFRVTTIVGSQLANNIDTRLLRMAGHIFVMGPCRHLTELDCLFEANHIDTYPLKKLKKHQVAWWSEEADHWTIFRKIHYSKDKNKASALHRLRQRKIRLPEQSLVSRWGCLGWIGYGIISFALAASNNLRYAGIFSAIIFGYILIREWISRNWCLQVESSSWSPDRIQDVSMPNNARRRPTKNFKIV